MYMVPMVEDSTTRRTPQSAATSTTLRVPVITGSMISSCMCMWALLLFDSGKKKTKRRKRNSRLESKQSAYGGVVHRGGGVDDAEAAGEGGPETFPVKQVRLHHGQPLRRAFQRPQVRVLGVICAKSSSDQPHYWRRI